MFYERALITREIMRSNYVQSNNNTTELFDKGFFRQKEEKLKHLSNF